MVLARGRSKPVSSRGRSKQVSWNSLSQISSSGGLASGWYFGTRAGANQPASLNEYTVSSWRHTVQHNAVPYMHLCIVLPRAPKASAALAQFTCSPPTGSRSGVRGAWQGCLMEGMLLKQGGKRSHAFKKRWITLSGVTVTYASSKTATALGEVPMAEVLGLGVSDEGADDAGKGIRLLWRKSCAGLDADYRRAQGYSVGQVPAFPLASSSMFSTSFDRWLVLRRNRKN